MGHHTSEEALFAYRLGALGDDEASRIRKHVDTCLRCAGLLAHVGEDMAQLAMALQPVQPQSLTRESLLHSLGEINRFTDLLAPLTEHLGKTAEETQTVLDRLDDPSSWNEADLAGVHFHNAEDLPGATFVRVAPGTPMPLDEGTENKVLILQGSVRNNEGTLHNPGDFLSVSTDELMDYVALAGPDLIYLAKDREGLMGSAG